MKLPASVVKNGKPLVQLTKSIYGLKQSSRQWNKKFNKYLKQFTFVASDADKCVYIGKIGDARIILALYDDVDDGLLMSADSYALSKHYN